MRSYQLDSLADQDGQKNKTMLTKLAKEYQVNIIGGSVATKRGRINSLIQCMLLIELEKSLRNTTKHIYLS